MICAISSRSMAHQWRKPSAPLLIGALREKGNGAAIAITHSPNGAPMAQQPAETKPAVRCRP